MTVKLFFQAIVKFTAGLILVGLLLFLPAGTFAFWQAWLLIGILFVPMLIAGFMMMFRNPKLLRKRLNAKEEQKEQKAVVALSGIMFLAAFVIAGLNFRFKWLVMPNWTVIIGTVVFLLAYAMYAEVLRENAYLSRTIEVQEDQKVKVLRENAYLSRTIEVQEDQKVIDTGLYGIVRHPMYSATLFLFISMGFVLASPISVAILLCYIPIIAKRMKNEEKILEEGLEGYIDYKKRVKYKVIPFVW